MNYGIQYPTSFSDKAKPKKRDVVTLSQKGKWDLLNSVIVCQDTNGMITARFGDDKWDISPYILGRKNYKTAFDFSEFTTSPCLQLELKLIVYGWMYHRSNKTNKLSKPTTLLTRFSKLKTVYRFLQCGKHSSLSALAIRQHWLELENTLIETNYAINTLQLLFGSINTVLILKAWLKIDFGFSFIESKAYSRKLSNKTGQQTLVIPERLSDAIYGKAIELVEFAHTHKNTLVNLKSALYTNRLEGKETLDRKIKKGTIKYLTDAEGNITKSQEYANQIIKHQPKLTSDLVKQYLSDIEGLSYIDNGIKFQRYLGQLTTACYICCGAFSGMRDSELGELRPNSYFCEVVEGREFHMLQSRTFKLGEQNETWVAAPIAKKAIELAASLTTNLREALSASYQELNPPIWLSQMFFYKPPVIICDWNDRLRRFCKHFDMVVTNSDYQECIESNPKSQAKVKKNIHIGQPWPLVSHQFRRSLAFYTIKHRLGTTISLKQQFKHLYLQMTEWYTNGGRAASLMDLKIDSELQATLEEYKSEDIANKFFNMVHNEEKLSGSHGKAIMQMRDNLPYIYSSWDVIYEAVKRKTLTLHGTAHSYCKNGYECDMDGVVNPAFCVDCRSGSSIIDKENARWWEQKHIALTAYLADTSDVSPSIYSHCITQIRAAEIVMKDFNIPFTSYEHPVKVVEL